MLASLMIRQPNPISTAPVSTPDRVAGAYQIQRGLSRSNSVSGRVSAGSVSFAVGRRADGS